MRAAVAHGVDEDGVSCLVDLPAKLVQLVLVAPVGSAAEISVDACSRGIGFEHVGAPALGHAVDLGLGGVSTHEVGVEFLNGVQSCDGVGSELRAHLKCPYRQRDAQGHVAGLTEVMEHLHSALEVAAVVEARDTERVGHGLELAEGCDAFFLGWLGKLGKAVEHRACIGEIAVEGTVLVVVHHTAIGNGGVLVDTCEIHRGLIDDTAMNGHVNSQNRRVGELLVQALVVGSAIGPGAQVEVADLIVGLAGMCIHILVNRRHVCIEIGLGGGKVAGGVGLVDDVIVAVHEAGHEHHASEVLDLGVGADVGGHVVIGADGHDGVALHGDGGGDGPVVVDGVDGGVLEHEVGGVLDGRLGLALGRGLGCGLAAGARGERDRGGGRCGSDEVAAGHLC